MLKIDVLKEKFVICRFDRSSSLPSWCFDGPFSSVTKSDDELSIITVESDRIPSEVRSDGNWRCLKLRGPFPFDAVGILLSILKPLANAEIGILAVSTFETDYVLVKDSSLAASIDVLKENGHEIYF